MACRLHRPQPRVTYRRPRRRDSPEVVGRFRATIGLEHPRPFHTPSASSSRSSTAGPRRRAARYRDFVQSGLALRRQGPSPNERSSQAWLNRQRDGHRCQPGYRGDDRDPRRGRGRRGRRGGCAGEGGVPGLAGRDASGAGQVAAAVGDARRGERRGARTDRVAERRQADRRRARRGCDGGRRLPLLRRRGRQEARRDDPRRRRRRHDLPRAARRRGADRAVELPAQHLVLEARAGARLRQHRRAQARRADAAERARARRASRSTPASPRA